MFDQQRIAKDIIKYCRAVFKEDNINYTDADIERGILIFFNLMRKRTEDLMLNGFQAEMEKALTRACITEQGEMDPLLAVASRIDGFLKRIYYFAEICQHQVYITKNQQWLIENLPGLPPIPRYKNETDRESWKGNGTGAYPIACALVIRNTDIHNVPEWDKAKVFEGLKYCLASYIFVTLKLESQLTTKIPDILENPVDSKSVTEEELQAFDFINYSRLTRTLRSQVMECFIQRTLFKDGAMEEEPLEVKVHAFIGKKTDTTVKHRIAMLEHRGFIERDSDGKLRLTAKRFQEMSDSETNCANSILDFKKELSNLLTTTPLDSHVEEVYAQLLEFLKLRYQETTEATFMAEKCDITEDPNSFLNWLIDKIGNDEGAKSLYRNIIELCRQNSIAYSLSIGKAIAALADSKDEALMAATMKRNVYLDSQVVLPMLCVAHKDFQAGNLWIYRNALQIKIQGKREYVHLRFAESYLSEIYGHVQQALKLASWHEFPTFGFKDFSRNVFYQHYIHLKGLGQLPEDALTYTDYLAALFSLDAYDVVNESIRGKSKVLKSEIEHMLEEDLGIELHPVPYYDGTQIRDSQEIFNQVILDVHSSKKGTATKLDAIMGHYLFEEEEKPRSIFVTRDTTFNLYRERMAKLYGKRHNYLWHLFSPTRFVVSNELTGMTINKDLLSDDLLMLLDDTNVRDNAKLFMDVNTRLTDIEGLTPAQIRKRMKDNFEFFSKQEIISGSEEELEYLNELATDLNTLWDEVRGHFSKTEEQEHLFQTALLDDTKYSSLMGMMASSIGKARKQLPKLLEQIQSLITTASTDLISGTISENNSLTSNK